MVKEGIVLGHKISKNRIEVDKAKVDVIAKLPHPTTIKGIHSFLSLFGFYRRFIQDFLKIAQPMTRLLEKDTLFFFSKECVEAFQTLKRKLSKVPILVSPDWDLPFELMSDASDFAIGTTSQNLAFVSSSHTDSTTDSVSVVFQSTSPQLDNEDLKQIDVDDLEEMDLRWQMAMLTMRAKRECRFYKDSRRPGAAELQRRTVLVETSTSNALVSQACLKYYAQLHTQFDKLTDDFRKSQFDIISYQTSLESVEARLLVYKQNKSVFEENIKLLNIEVQLRDTALVTLRQKLEEAEHDMDDLKLKLENFQTSSKNLTELLASQTSEKTGLGYNSQVFTKAMFDCDNYCSSKSDCEIWPPSSLYYRFQPSGGYHLSPTKPEQDLSHITRPIAPIIKDWVSNFEDESETKAPQFVPSFVQSSEHVKSPRHSVQPIETSILAVTPTQQVQSLIVVAKEGIGKLALQYALMTHNKPQKHTVPTAVLTQSKPVFNTAIRPVSAAMPKILVTRPRVAHPVVTKVTAIKAPVVSAAQDKTIINSGCSRYMTRNMSYLSDFEELNGRYVAFGGNPKGGKITGKEKIKTGKLDFNDVYFVKELKFNLFSVSQMCDKKNSVLLTDTECLVLSSNFKLPDESQVLLRVPKGNNMYNVNLKNIIPSGDLTCLFAKFCGLKEIKKEFSVARTPQQNGIAERKNRTLIEAARTMLADSLLPIPFWAEAVNTACYVQNRVLVTKPHNKNPYELLHGRTPSIGFMRPFGCPVTILNTLDPLGKFQGKVDEDV
uniref:Reverse transcriptase domain-containing protein n=1 Tax=Tanacetum cinerariifolium TaxID=118510 RepID=A0A6L2LP52_TANCI|nr:reverse transcriptase domain-containing protein [Tanacetum cinerariifolium]